MARPKKDGLDYFPLDIDFSTNAKTEAVMGEFGAKGVLFMIYLLSAVYRKGYYLLWDKLQQMQLVNRVDGLSPEMADQIVARLVAYGTFDKELFDSVRVLTSQRIQETFLDATKRRKQQKPTLYWINVDNNPHSKGVNDNINPQSKGKERKGKKKEEDAHTRPSDSAPKKAFDLWQELWGFPNSIAQQDLWEWINSLGDDVVCFGIGLAGKKNVSANGADTWLDRTFTAWTKEGVDSLEKAHQAAENHDKRMSNARGGYRKSTVKETLPDWANDDQEAKPEPQKQLTQAQKQQLAEQLARLKSNTVSKEG
ncbi:hypothetical protein LASUN_13360 [Lentilactobacillus sunkii]|uniref:Lin1244/Lin1753-like N-terminal domain-containing protein n=1 Tax=Lentilactobacillus sunkii TaxID=481719 RepID=A0A1E7XCD4_9LACO|nr:DUF4373 domain-containing protein [Lentilactobacillus sunkii]OFA10786.1 hypothetical protein LASUN_13360 [Lentilactobacillus sunkii]